jgi:hypothetical protein
MYLSKTMLGGTRSNASSTFGKPANTGPCSPWQNRAKGEIRELKNMIKRLTLRCNPPKRLWCFARELAAAIRRLTATDHALLRG